MEEEYITLRVPKSHINVSDAMNPFLLIFKDEKADFGDISSYKKLVIAEFSNGEGMIFDEIEPQKNYVMVACVMQVKYKDIPKSLRKILKEFGNPRIGERDDSPSPLFKWLGLQEVKGYWMFGEGDLPEKIRKGIAHS